MFSVLKINMIYITYSLDIDWPTQHQGLIQLAAQLLPFLLFAQEVLGICRKGLRHQQTQPWLHPIQYRGQQLNYYVARYPYLLTTKYTSIIRGH